MCGVKDRVLTPEAGEEQRKSAQRQHSHSVGGKSDWHESPQSSHAADVLLFVTTVNDRPRTQKEQRFEKRMGDEMKHANRYSPNTQTYHHVTQLRDRGVGENTLDIVLRNRY